MTLQMILQVMELGDKYGSALKELAEYYDIRNYDISVISDEMAENWIGRRNKNERTDNLCNKRL